MPSMQPSLKILFSNSAGKVGQAMAYAILVLPIVVVFVGTRFVSHI